jgi:Domain of unknown function (DUF4116)
MRFLSLNILYDIYSNMSWKHLMSIKNIPQIIWKNKYNEYFGIYPISESSNYEDSFLDIIEDCCTLIKYNELDLIPEIPEILRSDREFILTAILQCKTPCLEFADPLLRNNKDLVLKAVKWRGKNLKYASNSLKNDREIVLAAVKENGLSLKFASNILKANREIVSAAISDTGHALKFASDELKNDKELVLKAVTKSKNAFMYASQELKVDREIISAITEPHDPSFKDWIFTSILNQCTRSRY